MTNFATKLADAAAEDPNRPAVKLDDVELTYGQLDGAVASAAGLLRATGVEPSTDIDPRDRRLQSSIWAVGTLAIMRRTTTMTASLSSL